jgi:glycosyltransferase involved in cell wall biosynthesis
MIKFIHIGKCAGTYASHLFGWSIQSGKQIHLCKPVFNEDDQYVIWVRNPIARFVSAFNMAYAILDYDTKKLDINKLTLSNCFAPGGFRRKMKGEWLVSEEFDRLILFFRTPNAVAEALTSSDPKTQRMAKMLLTNQQKAHHIYKGIGWYLDDGKFVEKYNKNILFVGSAENTEEDIRKLCLKIEQSPQNKEKVPTRKNTLYNHKELSPLAVNNIKNFYGGDYKALRVLNKFGWISDKLLKSYDEYGTTNSMKASKIIWIYWAQGWDDAPEICKLCRDSWKKLNPTWGVREMDDSNLMDFVPADVYSEILKFGGTWPRVSRGDLIRLYLIARYGGVWTDATNLCNKPLDEWLNDSLLVDGFWLPWGESAEPTYNFLYSKAASSSWLMEVFFQMLRDSTHLADINNPSSEYLCMIKKFYALLPVEMATKLKQEKQPYNATQGHGLKIIANDFQLMNDKTNKVFEEAVEKCPFFKLTWKFKDNKKPITSTFDPDSKLIYVLKERELLPPEIPKIIWVYWGQGWDSVPYNIQQCRRSWEYYNPDWDIRLIDDKSLLEYFDIEEWVPGVGEKLINFLHKYHEINKKKEMAAKSDIVRINLLKKYGGVWADSTLWCHKPLNEWLPDHTRNGFFGFSRPQPTRLLCSWFLASTPGHYIATSFADKVKEYWETHSCSHVYFWFHGVFNELYEEDPKTKKLWDSVKKIEAPVKADFGPHLFAPHELSDLCEMSARYTEMIDSHVDPVYKLAGTGGRTGRFDRIEYLFNTITKKQNANKHNIIYIGTFSGPSGYAYSTRGYFKLLAERKDINLKVINIAHGAFGIEPTNLDNFLLRDGNFLNKEYIVIYHLEPCERYIEDASRDSGFDVREILIKASKAFSCVAWEPDRFPSYWRDFFDKYFNGVIVPSKWQQENFQKQMNLPVFLVPYPINVSPLTRRQPHNSHEFRILAISQWSYRKGFDILIQAFNSEFFDDPNVSLTIKTFGKNGTESEENEIMTEIKNYKSNSARYGNFPKCQIKLWCTQLQHDAMKSVYENCDLFALTTRGEGFGLAIAEALMMGKRVLVPDKGGHLDYVHDSNYFVESRMETLRCGSWSPNFSSEFKLVEPDFEDTRRKLRQAYENFSQNPREWKEKQQTSKNYVENYLSEDNIKQKLLEILELEKAK